MSKRDPAASSRTGKVRQRAARTPKETKSAKPSLPHPASDEYAYLVATYAWRDGLAANRIAKVLQLESTPKNLMRVKRALSRAHGKFLRLIPPRIQTLEQQLHRKVNRESRRGKPIRFHVVEDRWGPAYTSVSVRAATLVSRIVGRSIEQVVGTADSESSSKVSAEPPVVICNAGGRTISEMVRALLRNASPLEGQPETERAPNRLTFLAGNAAYLPEHFHRSANFLSVTMAEHFGASHLALPKVEDPGFPRHYRGLVDRASLCICGVGTPDTSLMGKYFRDRGWAIPENAVGDIAFNFLDRNGEKVSLPPEAQEFMNQVNPALNLPQITHIAANQRVLLILDSDEPESKTQISVAALKREYATDVVVGTRLAAAILRAY